MDLELLVVVRYGINISSKQGRKKTPTISDNIC
jgi:hypothetical protein